MIKKILAFLFWVYIVALIVGTVLPHWSTNRKIGVGPLYFRLDYWMHFFSYYGLSFLYILWKYSQNSDYKSNKIILNTSLFFIVAITTEIIQIFVPGRSFNIKDFFANSLGITLAMITCYILKKILLWVIIKKKEQEVKILPSAVKTEN